MTIKNDAATAEYRIGERGRFHLRHLSGSITIRGVDGDTVRIVEESGRAIADGYQIETTDDSVSLVAPTRIGFDLKNFGLGRRSSHDLDIEVPRGAEVSVESASGDIEGTNLHGPTRIRSASGDIDLVGLAGPTDIDSVSGDVSLTAAGPIELKVRSISGDLIVRAPQLTRTEIGTTSGDIRLDAVLGGTGPFEIQSVSGDVTIVGRADFQIEARTVTGDLESDLPHTTDNGRGRKRLIVGTGGTRLGFTSVSGDLRVVSPRDDPAAVTVPGSGSAKPAEGASSSTAPRSDESRSGGREVARMDVLRALERGDLSVDAAMRRIAQIEEA